MTLDDPLDFRLVDSAGCCRTCGQSVDQLPGHARYCPGCGARVRPPLSAVSQLRRRAIAIWVSHRVKPPVVSEIAQTRILVGYGNALYSLGWRYERGGGSPRNLAEAIRCYRKSARLGNADATLRLTSPNPLPAAEAVPVVPL